MWLQRDTVEVAVQETRDLFRQGKLKFFNTLAELRAEYSTYQRNDKGRPGRGREHMMACLHAFVNTARRRMRTEPVMQPTRILGPGRPGSRDWMW